MGSRGRFTGYVGPPLLDFEFITITGDSGATDNDNTTAPELTGPQGVSLGYGSVDTPPAALGYGGGKPIFYAWTATENGVITLDTSAGPGTPIGDTVVTVFTIGTGPVGPLPPSILASDDDSGPGFYSSLSFSVVAGTTYYIALDGYNSGAGSSWDASDPSWDPSQAAQGSFTLSWSFKVGLAVRTIVPRTRGASAAAQFPAYKRRTIWILFPPYIVYPPPPASPEEVTKERARYLISRSSSLAQQRRRAKPKLSPHHFVFYPTASKGTPKVVRVAARVRAVEIRRQIDVVYRLQRPVVVDPKQLPPSARVKITIVTVRTRTVLFRRQAIAHWKLWPPQVVDPKQLPSSARLKVTHVARRVRAVEIRRQIDVLYFLAEPVVVNPKQLPPSARVKVASVAVRVRTLEVRLRAVTRRSRLRAAVSTGAPVGGPVLGGIMVQYTQPPLIKTRTTYFLLPPVVVL